VVAFHAFRAVSSVGERLPYKQDVTGSNPVPPIALRPDGDGERVPPSVLDLGLVLLELRGGIPVYRLIAPLSFSIVEGVVRCVYYLGYV
jgi:hypothetical protein